jgi:hypothetical protein
MPSKASISNANTATPTTISAAKGEYARNGIAQRQQQKDHGACADRNRRKIACGWPMRLRSRGENEQRGQRSDRRAALRDRKT